MNQNLKSWLSRIMLILLAIPVTLGSTLAFVWIIAMLDSYNIKIGISKMEQIVSLFYSQFVPAALCIWSSVKFRSRIKAFISGFLVGITASFNAVNPAVASMLSFGTTMAALKYWTQREEALEAFGNKSDPEEESSTFFRFCIWLRGRIALPIKPKYWFVFVVSGVGLLVLVLFSFFKQERSIFEQLIPIPNSQLLLGFEIPKWGVTLEEIADRFPNGHVVKIDDDEIHYRRSVAIFGKYRSMATFCFRKKTDLRLLIIEFLAPEGIFDLSEGTFDRPNLDHVSQVNGDLLKWLTNVYGPAKFSNGSIVSGALTVFGRKPGDFARVDARPIGDNKINFTLWFANRGNDFTETAVDHPVIDGFWNTPTSTWGESSIFQLKWGMGPKDVAQYYPRLTSSSANLPDNVTYDYSVQEYIEGQVEMELKFFQGRLAEMQISPILDHALRDRRQREEAWSKRKLWEEQIFKLLQTKYGSPQRTQTEFTFFPDKKPNTWQWKTNETRISLIKHSEMRLLVYQERKTESDIQFRKSTKHNQEEKQKMAQF